MTPPTTDQPLTEPAQQTGQQAGGNDAFYDAEIGPRLLELAKLCGERGMSFVANVQYDQGETASTVQLTEDAGYKILLSAWGVRCHGNVDALWNQVVTHARKHGHSSVYLSLSGVPTAGELP